MRAVAVSGFILMLCAAAGAAVERELWDNRVSVGLNGARGNADTTQISSDILINRNNRWTDEYTFRGELRYSSSDAVVDDRKSTFWARYGFSFGEGYMKPWYGFVKAEADFDQFSDIDSRYIAGPGFGWWIYDAATVKVMLEIAGGIELTRYVSSPGARTLMIASPRAKLEKQFTPALRVAEEFTGYASVERFRFRSETTLVNTLTEHVALRISLVDDFNSSPFVPYVKNNDIRTTFAVQYTFPGRP